MAAPTLLDVYGFQLELNDSEDQARRSCEAKQQKRAAKWEKYFKAGKLPPASKLKKSCREVSTNFVLALLCISIMTCMHHKTFGCLMFSQSSSTNVAIASRAAIQE